MGRTMFTPFLSSLAGGVLVVLGFARLDLIAPRFIRLPAIISCTLSTGVTAWLWVRPDAGVAVHASVERAATGACALAAAVLLLLQPVAFARESRILLRAPAIVGGAFGMIAACLSARLPAAETGTWSWTLSAVVGHCLGSLLLGGVTVAWLLGHAYLTATRMTITPLQSMVRWFAVSVGLRGAYFAAGVVLLWTGAGPGPDGLLFDRLIGNWLVLSLRVGVGLLGVGAFAFMVLDCVRLRNTQSATGILYFASVFAYIGEIASQYLATEFSLPL